MEIYLTEDKLSGVQAYTMGLVQAIASSANRAQQLVHGVARWYASSIGKVDLVLQADLRAFAGELPSSERRILAVDAFAQARSFQAQLAVGASNGHESLDVVFHASDSPVTRGGHRKAVQAALSARGVLTHNDGLRMPKWRAISYFHAETTGSTDALKQFLLVLAGARVNQPDPPASADCGLLAEPPAQERRVETTRLAARFTDALSGQPDASPLDVLMSAHDYLNKHRPEHGGNLTDAVVQNDEPEPCALDKHYPCLLLLRSAKDVTGGRPPLVIAHSLLGDHRCLTRSRLTRSSHAHAPHAHAPHAHVSHAML